jgi:hypothetical protein
MSYTLPFRTIPSVKKMLTVSEIIGCESLVLFLSVVGRKTLKQTVHQDKHQMALSNIDWLEWNVPCELHLDKSKHESCREWKRRRRDTNPIMAVEVQKLDGEKHQPPIAPVVNIQQQQQQQQPRGVKPVARPSPIVIHRQQKPRPAQPSPNDPPTGNRLPLNIAQIQPVVGKPVAPPGPGFVQTKCFPTTGQMNLGVCKGTWNGRPAIVKWVKRFNQFGGMVEKEISMLKESVKVYSVKSDRKTGCKHVVTLYDIMNRKDGGVGIVMKLLNAGNLADNITGDPRNRGRRRTQYTEHGAGSTSHRCTWDCSFSIDTA